MTVSKKSVIRAASILGMFALAGCEAFAPLTKEQAASGQYSIEAYDAPYTPAPSVQFIDGHGQFTPRY